MRTSARTARRRAAAVAALGALAALAAPALAGCGIEPTEVIEVGQPAQGAKRPGVPVTEARLYFAFPGGLEPRSRPAGGVVSAEMAVPLLLQGPNEAERAQGLYSELPRMRPGGVEVVTGEGTVTIRLSIDPTRLSPIARNQLVCTASHNGVPGDPRPEDVRVDLTGAGKDLKGLVCDSELVVSKASPTAPPAASVLTPG